MALQEIGLHLYNAENQTDQKVSTMDRLSAVQVTQWHFWRGQNPRSKTTVTWQKRFARKSSLLFVFGTTPSPLVCLFAVPARPGMKGLTSKTEASNEDFIAVV
jgi:hypothetical protein